MESKESNKVYVLSVLPLLGHPRDSKRISMLLNSGFCVEAIAFQRPYHKGRLPDCSIQTMGNIEHGKYLSRIFKFLKAIPILRKKIKESDIIYASGLDMAAMSLVASWRLNKKVIVEIGDIREIQLAKGIKGWLFRRIDQCIVNSCQLIVVTAPQFLTTYYKAWVQTKTPGMVIENKLESDLFNNIVPLKSDNLLAPSLANRPLRIGYFGLLRDEWSLQVLEELAMSRSDDIEIILAGIPFGSTNELIEKVQKHSNVRWLGQYHSPADLPELYNIVDMVWACYPPINQDDWNLKWARPNRFYESCFFKKPIFTREGCQDAIDVHRYAIGAIIRSSEVKDAINEINDIDNKQIMAWAKNMTELPPSVYIYTNEEEKLRNLVIKIVNIDKN